MRKLIGTIVIILALYVGFFGCEKYNIEPFIINWFKSDKPEKLKEKITKVKDVLKEKEDSLKIVTDSLNIKLH